MREYLDQPNFEIKEPSINKDGVENVESVKLEKDNFFKKIEDLNFDIEDLKLNLELIETLIKNLELKKELLLSDNFIFETMLDEELKEINKSIKDLQNVLLKNKSKISDLIIRLSLEKINKESQIKKQIEQN